MCSFGGVVTIVIPCLWNFSCFQQALLHFIYRDTLIEDAELVASNSSCVSSVSETLTAKLLAAADKYELARLRLMCESHLCKYISVNSVAKILALADYHHAAELKAVCLRFSAENLAGISFSFHSCILFYIYILFCLKIIHNVVTIITLFPNFTC